MSVPVPSAFVRTVQGVMGTVIVNFWSMLSGIQRAPEG